MASSEPEQSNGTDKVSGHFMGWDFKLSGMNAIVVASLLVLIVVVVLVITKFVGTVSASIENRNFKTVTDAIEKQTATQSREHEQTRMLVEGHSEQADRRMEAIETGLGTLNRTLELQNYMLTLDARGRLEAQKKLRVPPELRGLNQNKGE